MRGLGQEPPIAGSMAAAVRDVAGGDPELDERAMRIAVRLQAPTRLPDGTDVYLHMPAVKEAMACLIPRDLHSRLDDKALKGKLAPSAPAGGVNLQAGRWQISVSDEHDLYENRALKKGMMDFFLIVANRVAEKLELPIAISTHKIGDLIAAATHVDHLRSVLGPMPTWSVCCDRLLGADCSDQRW